MVSPSNNIIEYRAQIFKPSSTFIINEIQLDATVRRYLFTAKSLYMFWVSPRPSSGVLKTVTAASGTGHNIGTAASLQRGQIGTQSRSGHVGGNYLYRRLR